MRINNLRILQNNRTSVGLDLWNNYTVTRHNNICCEMKMFGKDFPDPTLRIKRSPSYNDILRNSGKNSISSSFVNTEKKLSGFMKKEKSSSSFFGRSVSPIRRSIMEKAGKNKRAQVKARLSLQTFELPNGRFK